MTFTEFQIGISLHVLQVLLKGRDAPASPAVISQEFLMHTWVNKYAWGQFEGKDEVSQNDGTGKSKIVQDPFLWMLRCSHVTMFLRRCTYASPLCREAADTHAANGIDIAVKELWQEIEGRKVCACFGVRICRADALQNSLQCVWLQGCCSALLLTWSFKKLDVAEIAWVRSYVLLDELFGLTQPSIFLQTQMIFKIFFLELDL